MKSLIKRGEFTPIEELRRELDHIFDEMVPFTWWKEEGENGIKLWAPRTDMTENEDQYLIHVDLPGIPKEDVKVSYKDNRLTISGERNEEEKEEEDNFLRKERYFGRFVRTFTLPAAVKEDNIKANFKDGVLTVTVPKAEVSKPKTVEID